MCGIFAYLGHSRKNGFINEQFQKAQRRGPEFSTLKEMSKMCIFGFHRLAINGLNETSNQPLIIGDVTLICNGEIYNYRELFEQMGRTHETDSDCEIIIHLYRKYGIKHTLSLLDGVFSFVLLDNSNRPEKVKVYAARDPYGVRPLFISQSYSEIIFASELKQLCNFNGKKKQFAPGSYSELTLTNPNDPSKIWDITKENEIYTTFNFTKQEMHKSDYYTMIYNSLKSAVEKRVTTTERPIACLLSGGLDSSLITALVCEFINPATLETYSIGFEGSDDIKYASQVADYLGTKHTNVIVSEEDFFNAIPEVIYAIESYDTTTVRASVGNYLIAKYISEHSEAKVIFNGDGSDELIGGYLYFNKAPDQIEFDKECKRLLNDIHYFDVLRSDRCISSQGLEARTPFLDRSFVETFLSIPSDIRYHAGVNECEKYLLRKAVTVTEPMLLPENIVWRTKEAFSDGVSSQKKAWYEVIGDKVALIENIDKTKKYWYNPPQTLEQRYYRSIFEHHYKNLGHVIPYFWMPKYVEASDASARTLDFYEKKPLDTLPTSTSDEY